MLLNICLLNICYYSIFHLKCYVKYSKRKSETSRRGKINYFSALDMHSVSKLKVLCILCPKSVLEKLKSDQPNIAFVFSQTLSKSKRYVNNSTIEKNAIPICY